MSGKTGGAATEWVTSGADTNQNAGASRKGGTVSPAKINQETTAGKNPTHINGAPQVKCVGKREQKKTGS